MPFLIFGLLALIVIAAVLRSGANPALLMKLARWLGIAALVGVIAFLALTERWVPAVFLAGIAWSLFTGGRFVPGDWMQAGPRDRDPGHEDAPPARRASMSRKEALEVLGLPPGAGEDDIRAAHRRLILQNHPDKGGSDYLASKINEAKDVLLGG
jgi:DnaJ homolog subfamily C member 19